MYNNSDQSHHDQFSFKKKKNDTTSNISFLKQDHFGSYPTGVVEEEDVGSHSNNQNRQSAFSKSQRISEDWGRVIGDKGLKMKALSTILSEAGNKTLSTCHLTSKAN